MAKMGRPKTDNPRYNQVTARLSDEQLARLKAYCEKFSVSQAQVLLRGLNMVLDQEGQKSE